MSNLTSTAKKAPLWLKIVGVAAVGLIAAPFIVTVIKGVAGLIVASVVAFLALVFVPIIMDWILLKGAATRKAVVAANPIEKLEQLYAQRKADLRKFYDALQTFIGAVNGFEQQHAEMVRKYPHRRSELDQRLKTLLALKDVKMQKYQRAQENLTATGLKVDEARDIYKLACAATAAEAAGGVASDPMDQVMEQVAFDSITQKMNESFAALEMEMLQDHSAPELVIDVTPSTQQMERLPLKERV